MKKNFEQNKYEIFRSVVDRKIAFFNSKHILSVFCKLITTADDRTWGAVLFNAVIVAGFIVLVMTVMHSKNLNKAGAILCRKCGKILTL